MLVPIEDHDRLVGLTGGDPWVRWGLARTQTPSLWHDGASGAVAVRRTQPPYGVSLVLLPGPGGLSPATVAAALHLPPPGTRAPGLTAPRSATADVLAGVALAGLTPPDGGAEWEWMWTTDAPPAVPGEARVERLDPADPATRTGLTRLLAEHSPRHSASPDRPDVAGWVGVRAGDPIIACAAWVELVPGVPLLASVAVHPGARRRGLAAALTATITRRALAAGAPAVTVDLYSDNDDARRLYRRLGFRRAHAFTSWRW